ncbi:MAG: hypothetical protein ACKPE3_22065 [Sphaerospermopsis kisseleviana]
MKTYQTFSGHLKHEMQPGISRKTVSEELGVCEKQVQRYIKLAAEYLPLFADFIDPETKFLNGTPIENQKQIEVLHEIRRLIKKYKNTKNRQEKIANEIKSIQHQ